MKVGTEIYENEGYWRDGGKTGHGEWEPYEKIFNFIQKEFVGPEGRLLDLGCGPGGFIRYGEIGKTFGLDFSKYAAANPMPGAEGKITYGAIDDIPFRDRFFDVVTAFNIMEHVPITKICGAINEIFRVSNRLVIFMTCVSTDYTPSLSYHYNGEDLENFPPEIQKEILRGHWCVKSRQWWVNAQDCLGWAIDEKKQEKMINFTSSFIPETDHSWNRNSEGFFIYERIQPWNK